MKKLVLACIVALIYISVNAQLSGTVTVGASGDYSNLSTLINILNDSGVNGPLTVQLEDGNYQGQFNFGNITGTSPINTITIESASADQSLVTLFYKSTSSSDDWVIQIDSTSYLSFKNLTFRNTTSNNDDARIVEFVGTGSNVHFENIHFENDEEGSNDYTSHIYMKNVVFDSIIIDQCTFNQGSYAVYLDNSATYTSRGFQMKNCTINTQRSIDLDYQDAAIIHNNVINTEYNTDKAIYLKYCDSAIQITNNLINRTTNGHGIYLDNCDASSSNKGLIANNVINMGSSSYSISGAIYINTSEYLDIVHNSVNINSNSTSNRALYLGGTIVGIQIVNNVFRSLYEGVAIYSQNALTDTFSNNLLYSGGESSVYIDYNYYDHMDSVGNNHSLFIDNQHFYFNCNDTLKLISYPADNIGKAFTKVTEDINGNLRDASNPDVGAYEFTQGGTSYSGSNTVSPNGEFESLSAAMDSLAKYGIGDTVILELEEGEYTEQFEIRDFMGLDEAGIKIVSLSGDSSAVIISHTSTSDDDNYVANLYRASNVHFHGVTLRSEGTSYGQCIQIARKVKNLRITNCALEGSMIGSSTRGSLIRSEGQAIDGLTIYNSYFKGGTYGMYIHSSGSVFESKNLILKNSTFEDLYGGVSLYYFEGLDISSNEFIDASYRSISVNRANLPVDISMNKIGSLSSSNEGIYLAYIAGDFGNHALVNNNFIGLGTVSNSNRGLYIGYSDYISVNHNSILNQSTSTSSSAVKLEGNSSYSIDNIKFHNNNVVHLGNGFALHKTTNVTLEANDFDYNNYFTYGNYIVDWENTDLETFNDYLAQSSVDQNSLNVYPNYASEYDLHTNAFALDNAGKDVNIITDIDGEIRDENNPDIGADEFTSTQVPLNGVYEIGTGADFETFNAAVNALEENGISGNVIFNVLTDTYIEQVSLSTVAGTETGDSIIFQSKAMNEDSVELLFDGADLNENYVFQMFSVSGITFKHITFRTDVSQYSILIDIYGSSDHINFDSCKFVGDQTATSGNAYDASIHIATNDPIVDTLRILNCSFENNAYGLYVDAKNSRRSRHLVLRGNHISSLRSAVYMRYSKDIIIQGNTIDAFDYRGLDIQYNYENILVKNNKIISDEGYYGIYMYGCNGLDDERIYLVNNIINLGHRNSNEGIYGLYVYNGDYINVFHNSVNVTSKSTSAYAAEIRSNADIDVRNNIFAITGEVDYNTKGTGRAVYYSSNTFIKNDHNVYYTSGPYLFRLGTPSYSSLSDLVDQSGANEHSLFVHPAFENDHLESSKSKMDTAGVYIDDSCVVLDINGNRRSTNVSVGAYQYESSSIPMSGKYYVGLGEDYDSLHLAIEDLISRGIDSTVHIILATDSQEIQFTLPYIDGTDTDSLIFEGDTLIGAKIVFEGANDSNYVMQLNGVRNTYFRNLYFHARDNNNYGRVIGFVGLNENFGFDNCTFSSRQINYYNTSFALMYNENAILNNYSINNCSFQGGSYSIYFENYSNIDAENVSITNNHFENIYTAIYMRYARGISIQGNTIIDNRDYAINLTNVDGSFEITENEIYTDYGSGISINTCLGELLNQAEVRNNAIFISTSYPYGIHVKSSQYVNLYYNTVYIESTSTSTRAANFNSNTNLKAINNIFRTSKGTAFYHDYNDGVSEASNNLLFSFDQIAYTYSDGAIENLVDLQSTTGMHQNSVVDSILVANDSLLAPLSTSVIGQAKVITVDDNQAYGSEGTHLDLYGNQRDQNTPDIGAYEASCKSLDMEISINDLCVNTIPVYEQTVNALSPSNLYYWDFGQDGVNEDTTSSRKPSIDYVVTNDEDIQVNLIVHQLAGCIDTIDLSATVLEAASLSFMIDSVRCSLDNGRVEVSANGGQTPYQYLWSTHVNDTLNYIDELQAGKYQVTVTDSLGCISVDSVEVFEDTVYAVQVEYESVPARCGYYNGSIQANGVGGTAPYHYDWYYNPDTSFISGLYPGTYYLTVTDSIGCSKYETYVLNDTNYTLESTMDTINTSCDLSIGQAKVSVSGGTGNYTYQWRNQYGYTVQGDSIIDSLSYGMYHVIATDKAGCFVRDTVFIDQDTMRMSIEKQNPLCFEGEDAWASVTVTGGKGEYSYKWETANSSLDLSQELGDTIDSVRAGLYRVTVQDTIGCLVSDTFIIWNPLSMNIQDSVVNANCGQSNGSIEITTRPLVIIDKYKWTVGDSSVTDQIDNLPAGMYEVELTDRKGCVESKVIMVNDEESPSITFSDVNHLDCFGADNGTVTAHVNGGAKPYNIFWSNAETDTILSNLSSGTYELVVLDDQGCRASKEIEITSPEALQFNPQVQNANCNVADGSIQLGLSGGEAPYTYNWSNQSTASSLQNIAAGIYKVLVADNNGCIDSTVFALSEIGAPVLSIDSIQEEVCGGNGGVNVKIEGGSGNYSYSWSNGDKTLIPDSLFQGNHQLTVIDSNGCTASIAVQINRERPLKDPICLVSVDSVSGGNLIVWQKANTDKIAQYNIYREGNRLNQFFKIGEVPVDSLSQFVDLNSDYMSKSYKYKIAVQDTCGNESYLSDPHKTIRLGMYRELQTGGIGLIWNHYKGFDILSYKIYRYSYENGWEMIDELPSDNEGFTDTSNIAVRSRLLKYYIEVEKPGGGCTSTRAQNHNSSKSNNTPPIINDKYVGIIESELIGLNVYPNPNEGQFTINTEGVWEGESTVQLVNLLGEVVFHKDFEMQYGLNQINVDQLKLVGGLYLVKISNGIQTIKSQVVIQD